MGPLLVFEGGEGSGKSSQSQKLYEALQADGVAIVKTRDPGGTPSAEEIRNLLVQGAPERWKKTTEMLLFTAARTELVEGLILPSMRAGNVVISDRFIDSTLAYQAHGNPEKEEIALSLHKHFCHNLAPDLTVLLDIDAKVGLARSKKRLGAEGSAEDRFEAMGLAYHQRLRELFLKRAAAAPERYLVVDATLDQVEIFGIIRNEVNRRFHHRFTDKLTAANAA